MIFANDAKGNRIVAAPGQRAVCPSCNGEVVAKCGKIKVWHWAHLSVDCDPWSEGMTEWHIGWQNEFPEECREVVIQRNGEIHRADIMLPDGTVIEFQHSPISQDEIAKREEFYGEKMAWMFDLTEAVKSERFTVNTTGNYHPFRWKHARVSVLYAKRKLYFDLSNGNVLDVRKLDFNSPVGGWGYVIDSKWFASNPSTDCNSLFSTEWIKNDELRRVYEKELNKCMLIHASWAIPSSISFLQDGLNKIGATKKETLQFVSQFMLDVGASLSLSEMVLDGLNRRVYQDKQ